MKSVGLFLAESPWGAIDGDAMNKGLGGRETALVKLAQEFAAAGLDVYAFVPRGDEGIRRDDDGVRWLPNGYVIEMAVALDVDVFISWENTQVLEELRQNGYEGVTAIEMQVAHLESHDPDVKVSTNADYVCVLSKWAADFFVEQHPDCHDRMLVFPNGIDLRRFEVAHNHAVPHPTTEEMSDFHFIYSSSPDRGLHHLLAMWPAIYDRIMAEYGTSAHLHICYGVENFLQGSQWNHREDGERAREINRLLGQHNVVYHGKIGQDELAALMLDCDLMLYPCDTMSPTETGCISICEALAAGTPVVTTDCDCIGPDYHEVTTQINLPFWQPTLEAGYMAYIEAIMDALNPEDYGARVEAGTEFVKQRDWSVIADQWLNAFSSAA